MENRKVPALIALAGIVIAVVVFLFVANDDTADQESETTQSAETQTAPPDGQDKPAEKQPEKPDKPAEPEAPQLEIRGGEPVGGPLEMEVKAGDELRIEITTDAPDELHLHGYDVYLDIAPGKTNELLVENADIEGVVELESHSTGAVFAEISVVPG